ncbi:hypothetical protein ACBY01_16025 [Sphingomonas sp. ac-8]|uniref:hypothetical protein n=1 Tax=Sphingomonas sp. ac-8 TaxID=3242977 RepID=UPI003A7FCAE6
MIALTACGSADDRSGKNRAAATADESESQQNKVRPEASSRSVGSLPDKYVKAFACVFDQNPMAAFEKYHRTPAGRAERASDLTTLRSLGFDKRGSDGDLPSLGGKIAAPSGLTIFGLPVRSLELNGMIGDANAMYVTTFARGITVAQIVGAARLEMDHASYRRYRIRHYSRRVGDSPPIDVYLDDRGGSDAKLVCQVQSTPD